MELETAIQHALDGNAVLFLGSGFSSGAVPVGADKFLTGRELSVELSKAAGIDPPSEELNFSAQRYRRKFSDHKLVELLQKLFTASAVSDSHRALAEIPWQAIYTTNYDNVLEKAFAEKKKRLTAVTCDQDSKEFTSKKHVAVHINGFIDTLTPSAIDTSFKLTNTSYLTESFKASKWSFMFRRAIESCRACIFIGYSMYDLDIQRIIFSAEASAEKTVFIERVGKTEADIANSIQVDFGTVYPIGLPGFVEAFAKIRKTYVPQDVDDSLLEFEELMPPSHGEPFRDDDLFDLFLKGDPKLSFIWDTVNGNKAAPYFIQRKHHESALQAIASDAENVVAFADMANGKTLFLTGLACKLRASGYRVFWLRDDAGDSTREVETICSLEQRTAVIIENYNNRLDEVRLLQGKRRKHLKLLLSAKRTSHEVFFDDLSEILDAKATVTYDLDQLSGSDLDGLDGILSSYKLWGERDAWNRYQKHRYLEDDCNSEFSSVLLDIIKSPSIQEKFKALFDSFKNDGPIVDVIVASSVLTILGFNRPRDSVISELLQSNYLYSLEFRRNPISHDLVRSGGGSITPRSSILAKYGLTNFMEARPLVDRLIRIAKAAHDLGDSALYFGIYRDLVTFSTLQRLLPERGKRDALIRFYEALKNLTAAQNHPHFWLQYAIARLASGRDEDLDKARLFLETAYAHARRRKNYHTRHMDNVKARYLIRHSITVPDISSALLELSDGHKLLIAQARTEKTYAAFNVASGYLSFYNAKRDRLDANGRLLLTTFGKQILGYIPGLPDRVRAERSVVQCQKDLTSMLADLADNGNANSTA